MINEHTAPELVNYFLGKQPVLPCSDQHSSWQLARALAAHANACVKRSDYYSLKQNLKVARLLRQEGNAALISAMDLVYSPLVRQHIELICRGSKDAEWIFGATAQGTRDKQKRHRILRLSIQAFKK